MDARQSDIGARLLETGDRSLLAVGGDLESLAQVGLGFDPDLVHTAQHAGLQPLPRPVSYPWPTAATIERTLAQAADIAQLHSSAPAVVAFQGDGAPGHPGELILGHEMLMSETIAALQRHGMTFAYFAESRHQRGDWFVAKSLAPNVMLAHEFTQPQLVPEDMYSAAHRWGLLARERGIRLAVLQLFKVVHATTPRDCVDYVAALADVLVNREGMRLSGRPEFRPAHVHHSHDHGHGHHHHHDHEEHHHEPESGRVEVSQSPAPNPQSPLPALARDDDALPWISLIPAGAGALALAEFLDLPQKLAVPLTLTGLLAPLAVRRLDRPANELEAAFRPSYAPKLIALGITTTAPLAASLVSYRGGPLGILQGEIVTTLAAAGLAATVGDRDYALRIEEVKTYGLDWIVPLAGALSVALAQPLSTSRSARYGRAEVETGLVEIEVNEVVAQAEPAVVAPRSMRSRGSKWAQRNSLRLADRALVIGLAQGARLLRDRLPGFTGDMAAWGLTRSGGLVRQRLLQPAIASFDAPKQIETAVAEIPVRKVARTAPVLVEPAVMEATGIPINQRAMRLGLMTATVAAGLVLARAGLIPADPLEALDQEHTAEHTHHLSRAQAAIGDSRMAISPRPLRKWSLPTVVALAATALLPGRAADGALVAATLGETAFLAGFRQAARPLVRTVDRSWDIAGHTPGHGVGHASSVTFTLSSGDSRSRRAGRG